MAVSPPSQFRQHVPLADYTTMRIGGACDYLVVASDVATVKEACSWANEHELPLLILGEGSNMIVDDQPIHRLVLKMEIAGFEVVAEDDDSMTLEIGAGMHWDDAVARSVELGLAGIEAMSMIPGTVGAAPVQNAGAYGQEIADTLVEVEAYDQTEHKVVTLAKADCGFAYRDSRFKGALAGRYVIVSVTLKLSKRSPAPPTYASLKRYLEVRDLHHPTVAQIRQGVMAVRAKILPDPSVVPNAGSFFKNPIVEPMVVERLRALYPEMPAFAHGDNYKLSAGWLLDQCGLRGAEHFGLVLYAGHPLVITNPKGAGYSALVKLVAYIQTLVRETYDVTLEPEPLFIG